MSILLGFLLSTTLFADPGRDFDIPPETEITTTLVVEKITETEGAGKFGFEDVAVLDGIRVEQTDSFENIDVLFVENDGATARAVCNFAGYQGASDESVATLGNTVETNGKNTMEYDDQTKQFHLSTGRDALTRVGCLKKRATPLPGKTRIAQPDAPITFELNADKIERLILPTGKAYIRIVNPNVSLSRSFFSATVSRFGATAPTYACKAFGYSGGIDIHNVTQTERPSSRTWYLSYDGDWMSYGSWNHFKVLTCNP